MNLTFATRKFWRERCKKHFGCVPDVQVKHTHNISRTMFYALGTLEDGYTVENTIDVGLRL